MSSIIVKHVHRIALVLCFWNFLILDLRAETPYPKRVVNGCVIQEYTQCPNINWKGENLNSSRLHNADLHGGNLSGATFFKAGLSHADLRNTDLRWANLNKANLVGADLRGANIEGASMKGATLSGAIWIDGRRCAGDSNATGGWDLAFASGGSHGECR